MSDANAAAKNQSPTVPEIEIIQSFNAPRDGIHVGWSSSFGCLTEAISRGEIG